MWTLRWLLKRPRLPRVPKNALRASLLVSDLERASFRKNRNILWKQSWQSVLTLTGQVSGQRFSLRLALQMTALPRWQVEIGRFL